MELRYRAALKPGAVLRGGCLEPLEILSVKHLLVALSLSVAALGLSLAPGDADAKRLGGGKPAGMQRQMPAKPADATPAKPANAAAQPAPAAPAAAPATPPKRSWMGPLAGLAAGLGLAALFSHFGLGEGLSNVLMMVLLAGVAFLVIRFVMSRFGRGASPAGGPQLAGAGAPIGAGWQPAPAATLPVPAPLQRAALDAAPAAAAAATTAATPAAAITLPGGMDKAEFERLAKMVFIRMQAANDAGNVDDLRKFTTPELFASLRLDLQERGAARQQTDVVQIDAEVLDTARENGQDVVTVRFHGLIREAAEAGAEPFNELWHLVRAADGAGEWAIAGITPVQ
jgi:predicted lipid-binding transport protein (Tim44 family)